MGTASLWTLQQGIPWQYIPQWHNVANRAFYGYTYLNDITPWRNILEETAARLCILVLQRSKQQFKCSCLRKGPTPLPEAEGDLPLVLRTLILKTKTTNKKPRAMDLLLTWLKSCVFSFPAMWPPASQMTSLNPRFSIYKGWMEAGCLMSSPDLKSRKLGDCHIAPGRCLKHNTN